MYLLRQLWGFAWRGCWHVWSNWEKIGTHGTRMYQARKCKKCGLEVRRNAGWRTNREDGFKITGT